MWVFSDNKNNHELLDNLDGPKLLNVPVPIDVSSNVKNVFNFTATHFSYLCSLMLSAFALKSLTFLTCGNIHVLMKPISKCSNPQELEELRPISVLSDCQKFCCVLSAVSIYGRQPNITCCTIWFQNWPKLPTTYNIQLQIENELEAKLLNYFWYHFIKFLFEFILWFLYFTRLKKKFDLK